MVFGQDGEILQQVVLEVGLALEILEEDEVGESYIIAGDKFAVAQEAGEQLQLVREAVLVGLLEIFVVRVVDDPDEVHVEVAHLGGGQVHTILVGVSLALKSVLPGQMAQDCLALGQLDIAVQIVRQVWEVQAEGELFAEPLASVEIRWAAALVKLVLVLDVGMRQQVSDGVAEPPDVPISKNWCHYWVFVPVGLVEMFVLI